MRNPTLMIAVGFELKAPPTVSASLQLATWCYPMVPLVALSKRSSQNIAVELKSHFVIMNILHGVTVRVSLAYKLEA